MKYVGMPMGRWILLSGSFRKQLEAELGYSRGEARRITGKSKRCYRKLIAKLPEFEKKDRFKMNIVNCAMLSSFLLKLPERPSVSQATEYYKSYDDRTDEMVLSEKREKEVYGKRYSRDEGNGCFSGCRQKSVFLEHGFLSISGRKRVRSPVYKVRDLCAYEEAWTAGTHPGYVPFGLHDE